MAVIVAPVRPLAFGQRWTVALFYVPLGACEPRVQEPQPEVRTAASLSVTSTSSTSTSTSTSGCPRPTPPTPTRQVQGPVPDPRCPADSGVAPNLKFGSARFLGGELEVALEIAEKDEHRQRGLMFRKALPEAQGMLFVFEQEKPLSFWMKNTCIPLDMIFIAENGTIVGIEENTPTMSLSSFGPPCPAKYVIEVNAGFTRKHGITSGQKVNLVL